MLEGMVPCPARGMSGSISRPAFFHRKVDAQKPDQTVGQRRGGFTGGCIRHGYGTKLRFAEKYFLLLRPAEQHGVLKLVVVAGKEGNACSEHARALVCPGGKRAYSVDAAGSLLQQRGIPRQVVMNDLGAFPMQVYAFGSYGGAEENVGQAGRVEGRAYGRAAISAGGAVDVHGNVGLTQIEAVPEAAAARGLHAGANASVFFAQKLEKSPCPLPRTGSQMFRGTQRMYGARTGRGRFSALPAAEGGTRALFKSSFRRARGTVSSRSARA